MPYSAREGSNGKWEVFNTGTGQVRAEHEPPDAKEKAERQVILLNRIESDPQWEKDNG